MTYKEYIKARDKAVTLGCDTHERLHNQLHGDIRILNNNNVSVTNPDTYPIIDKGKRTHMAYWDECGSFPSNIVIARARRKGFNYCYGTGGIHSKLMLPSECYAPPTKTYKPMKIFRYKLIVEGDERILSIGVIVGKYDRLLHAKYEDNTTTITNKSYTEYEFGHAIVAVKDKFDSKVESLMLKGRIEKAKLSEYDVELPTNMTNNTVLEGLVLAYRRNIIKTIVSKFANVKGKEIKIEDYNIGD